jgi:hypothetical protein
LPDDVDGSPTKLVSGHVDDALPVRRVSADDHHSPGLTDLPPGDAHSHACAHTVVHTHKHKHHTRGQRAEYSTVRR